MKFTIMDQGAVQISSEVVSLGMVQPILNGEPLTDWQLSTAPRAEGGVLLRYQQQACTFGIAIAADCTLQYWVEGLGADVVLDSFGVRFVGLENLRAFLRNGYYSWDGSTYIHVDTAQGQQQGYAMIQLLPRFGSGSVVLGFDRHDRFQHTFTVRTGNILDIETLWDRKTSDGRCTSERLFIFEHPAVEDALRHWARLVAQAAPIPPRQAERIIGWCSWYNLYAAISEENIREQLAGVQAAANRENLPMRVFQLDDGFTPEMGDWLEVKPQFPNGIKPLLDEIRAAGFVPGLWIAPFMVGNRSKLYQAHPDWVVMDRETGHPLAHMAFYGEFRWHKRSEEYYILDATHPQAFAYLREVFHTWRYAWGCDYFKTDFMHFGSEHGPQRAVWHRAGSSRIEIWRQVAALIRDSIGDALWLGCGCPLWASVGLVDGIRIGRDVGAKWQGGDQSAQSLLRDQATRNFANGILWQADPDCILLRDRFHHLTHNEVHALAHYAGMTGGVLMTSDALHELSEERLALWKQLVMQGAGGCDFPLLGQDDAVVVQVRREATRSAVFVLNTGEQLCQRRYPLAALGLPNALRLYDADMTPLHDQPIDHLAVTVAPHSGLLFFLASS